MASGKSFVERILRTDTEYLVKNSLWSLASYVVQVASGILITIVFANTLAPEVYGTYQFILSLVGIITAFSLTGIGTALTREVAQTNAHILAPAVRIRLRWNIGIAAIALTTAGYYFLQHDTTLALSFLLAAVLVPLTEAFIVYESFLVGKKSFRELLTLGLWRKPLPIIALLITIVFTQHIVILLGVYFASNCVATYLVYRAVLARYPTDTNSVADQIIPYARHISVLNANGLLTEQIDKIIIWHFLGPVQVAIYSIAQLATKYAGGGFVAITQIVLPKVSQLNFTTLQQTLPRKVGLSALMMLLATMLYVAIAPLLLPFLFPEYPAAILITQILSLSFVTLPALVFMNGLIAHQKTRAIYIIGYASLFSKALFLFWGVLWGGIIGLAIGYTAEKVTTALLTSVLFYKSR